VVERVEPIRLLSWRVVDDGSLIAEELRETSRGTRMIVTHLPDARDTAWASRVPSVELGWRESLADLALYVERGVSPRRHMVRRSALGALTRDTPAGVEIGQIEPIGFAARAGMEVGDLLIAVGQAPVFTRSDLALLLREHLPGSEWDVSYVRDGAIRTTRAPL
jgi:hypothetical protein